MKKACFVALWLAISLQSFTSARQATENINVLPVVPAGSDPEYFLKGDAYLQRQVEPTMVASTRNPNHLAAFYIDYRTVDIADDVNVGGGGPSFASNLWSIFKGWLARLAGRPETRPVPVAAAPAEANIGYSRSYDGGLTWSGALLPGLSFDSIPSPIKNYAATTDPVAAAGPCGSIYLAFVPFNRGGDSAVAVAKFADLDNSTSGEHTILYKGMSIVATSNNATNGPFNDKVAIAVDIDRSNGASGCAHRVFVAYTEFDGLDKDGKFQSKAYLATRAFADETSSLDGVTDWTKREISGSFTQNQGTAIAVDPLNGDVYVFWRHFFKPDTILFAKGNASSAAGARLGKPAALFSDVMATFDQPSVSIAFGPENLAFRANAFPVAAVAVDAQNQSRVFAAWHERVDASGSPAAVGGSPRIVLTHSSDGGSSWTPRAAVDMGNRPPEPEGLGFANGLPRPSYPQVFPALSFGGGQLMLAYYEARGEVGPSGFITAYNRILDLRAALLDRSNGTAIKSFQVSRYPIKPWAPSPSTSNSIADLEPVNPPCSPDYGVGFPPCVPRVNRVVPQSAGGTVAFMGDYNWLTPSVQFVPDGNGGWKWATRATDVPWVGGHTVFADNRNLVPPLDPPEELEWDRYTFFGPAGLPNCINAASRNTDVLTSRLSLGLLVTAPLTWRPTPAELPFTVWNNTNQRRFFRLSIETAAFDVGFGKPGTAFENTVQGVVQILPYSSSSHVLYVNETGSPRVTVKVTEVANYDGDALPAPLTGRVTFNAETGHPPPLPATNTKAIEVSNPFPENPFPENPFPENPFPENPFPENPFPENPFPENTAVEDVSWTVTAPTALDADTVAAYAALIGIDKAYWSHYGFQLIISKPSTTGVVEGCSSAFNLPQGTVVANYFLPSLTSENPFPENPFPENPFPENPFPENPFPENPFPENSAFTIAPSDSSSSTSSFSTFTAAAGPSEAPPAVDLYKITLRVYQKPGAEQSPDFVNFDANKNAPVVKMVEKNCDPESADCTIAESPSPELYIVSSEDPPTTVPDLGGVSPNPVSAGQTITLPGSPAVKNAGSRFASDRRHGYFLVSSDCALPVWGSKPSGNTVPDCATLVDEQIFLDPDILPEASSENLLTNLTIPFTTSPGIYRVLVYADYRREVSESNEYNNWAVSQAFEILPPAYAGILGLFTPCSGATCERSTGSAAPLAWQFTFDGETPVDSESTQPRLKIFAPLAGGACQPDPSVAPLFVADPTNVSSGGSLWQYFDASCLPVGTTACPRDAFTHQYNWQTKDPVTGANLPVGCYAVVIESPSTGQVIGSALGPVETVQVTLR